MPGFVAPAGLHGGQDTHHAGMLAAFLQNRLHPVFFPKALLAPDELDLHPIFGSDSLHVFAQAIAQRFGPLRVIENPDPLLVEVCGHPAGITPPWHRTLDDDPVITGKNSSDFVFAPLRQEFDAHSGIVTDFPVWFRLCRVRIWRWWLKELSFSSSSFLVRRYTG